MENNKRSSWNFIIPWLAANYSGIIFGHIITLTLIYLLDWFDISRTEGPYNTYTNPVQVFASAMIILPQFLSITIAQIY